VFTGGLSVRLCSSGFGQKRGGAGREMEWFLCQGKGAAARVREKI
jgi:hypothetical protein